MLQVRQKNFKFFSIIFAHRKNQKLSQNSLWFYGFTLRYRTGTERFLVIRKRFFDLVSATSSHSRIIIIDLGWGTVIYRISWFSFLSLYLQMQNFHYIIRSWGRSIIKSHSQSQGSTKQKSSATFPMRSHRYDM